MLQCCWTSSSLCIVDQKLLNVVLSTDETTRPIEPSSPARRGGRPNTWTLIEFHRLAAAGSGSWRLAACSRSGRLAELGSGSSTEPGQVGGLRRSMGGEQRGGVCGEASVTRR